MTAQKKNLVSTVEPLLSDPPGGVTIRTDNEKARLESLK